MKYIFNFENREKPLQFNREKLLLSALQDPEQLYYMMDTQFEGIYQAEAVERKRLYGSNSYKGIVKQSKFKWWPDRKADTLKVLAQMEEQKISVFRKGAHFYAEIDAEDLVPGDVIFISEGDIIPADLRIIFSKDLVVDQRLYTGETATVTKGTVFRNVKLTSEPLMCLPNICFAGTEVVGGLARGVVVATGKSTYLYHLLLM